MSRYFLVSIVAAAVAAAVGCAAPVESEPESGTQDETDESANEPVRVDHDTASDWNPCSLTTAIRIDGKTILIPVACAPYDRDRGDPPPDARMLDAEQRINPADPGEPGP